MKLRRILFLAISISVSNACYANHSAAADAFSFMALPNDDVLYNAPSQPAWSRRASVTQGVPRGDAAPSWWVNDILDASITTSQPWNAMTLWFSSFEAQSNHNTDFKVVLGKPEAWVLRGNQNSSDALKANWERLPESKFNWAAYFSNDMIGYIQNADAEFLNNGNVEYQISSQHYPTHGGTSKIAIDGKNVLGVFVRVRAWLEPNAGQPSSSIDDVKYLLSIGADYYPEVDSSVSNGDFANANYLPGAGGSRFAYVTKDPKWFYMVNASPDDLSIVDKTSAFYQAGGKTYLTHRELIDNPPIIEKTDTQM